MYNHSNFNRFRRGKKKSIGDINITPFVDIVLVLLIIFMVVSPMLNNGYEVNLPKVSSNEISINKKEQIIFTIDTNRGIRIDDKVVKLSQVQEYLKNYDNINTQIFVKGDKDANYGLILELVAIINKSGFTNLSLITLPLNKE